MINQLDLCLHISLNSHILVNIWLLINKLVDRIVLILSHNNITYSSWIPTGRHSKSGFYSTLVVHTTCWCKNRWLLEMVWKYSTLCEGKENENMQKGSSIIYVHTVLRKRASSMIISRTWKYFQEYSECLIIPNI